MPALPPSEARASWHVLVVQEDFAVGGLVRYALSQEGRADVEVVGTPEAALDYVRGEAPDLVVIDIAYSSGNMLDLCQQLRTGGVGSQVPIIVTAPELTEANRVLALDLGADDCVIRPFGIREFAARARAVVRRRARSADRPAIYRCSRLVADCSRFSLTVDG